MAIVACLDTRFYFAHAQEESAWTRKVVDMARLPGSRIVSSTITIAELLSAMGATVGSETVHHRIKSVRTAGIGFVPPSEEIAAMAGEMLLRDRELPLADAVIAATAVTHTGGRVYTDDPHFSKIPGIRVFWGRA